MPMHTGFVGKQNQLTSVISLDIHPKIILLAAGNNF